MPLPERLGVSTVRAILRTLVVLAMLPALVSWATPASPHDESTMARKVAFRTQGVAAARPVGQFTRASTKRGLPLFLFQDGLAEFWGSCGGTIAINPSSMSARELKEVRRAAGDFAATASGPWAVTTTTASAGSGSEVVVVVDAAIASKSEWGMAGFTTSFGMETATPKFFMKISNATVHLSGGMAAGQSASLVRAVTLHELGHIAGADHNQTDPQAIMAPTMDQAHLGYSVYTSAEAAGIRDGGSHACSSPLP
jgi:hypothetical protein